MSVSMNKRITIVIPTAPGKYPETVLRSVKGLNYPRDDIEIIIAEGKQPARQRNEAIEQASGEIIFFFDADVTVDADIVDRMLKHYEDDSVAVVGGPNLTPETDTPLQKYFGYAMASGLATSSMSTRYKQTGLPREADERDLILCNLSVRRSALEKEGAFVESLWPNEENELLTRFRFNGYRLIYEPKAVVYHTRRATIASFVRQLFGYGRGRAEQILMQPSAIKGVFVIPSLFLLYLLSIPFVIPLWHLPLWLGVAYGGPLFLYIGYCLVGSLKIAHEHGDAKSIIEVLWIFPLIHLSYGAGFIYGLLKPVRWKQERKRPPVSIQVISGDSL